MPITTKDRYDLIMDTVDYHGRHQGVSPRLLTKQDEANQWLDQQPQGRVY